MSDPILTPACEQWSKELAESVAKATGFKTIFYTTDDTTGIEVISSFGSMRIDMSSYMRFWQTIVSPRYTRNQALADATNECKKYISSWTNRKR